MIKRIVIKNFKIFDSFELNLNPDLNIIVGDNETGKSTLLEAICLALTKKIGGRALEYELSPFLFNKETSNAYLQEIKEGKSPEPPKILIELYLSDESEVQTLLGTNNSRKENSPGVKLEVEFNDEYQEDYDHLLQQNRDIRVVPIEYYKVKWYSFANETLTPRSLPVGLSNIDATSIRLNSGTELGIEKLVLLHSNKTLSLAKLPADTQNYFKKLSGYDTLRLVLAERAILVEGPSDELIVQKAYLLKYGKLPRFLTVPRRRKGTEQAGCRCNGQRQGL